MNDNNIRKDQVSKDEQQESSLELKVRRVRTRLASNVKTGSAFTNAPCYSRYSLGQTDGSHYVW
jgi:hypothetical protein